MSNKHNRSNFNPEVWGPNGWFFLDTIVLSYPENPSEKHKKMFFNFFNNIGKMLPCKKCRDNYEIHINKKPLSNDIFESNKSLLSWWLDIHNLSRMTLDKKEIKPDEFINYYKDCYTQQKKLNYDIKYLNNNQITKGPNDLSIIFFIAFIILLIFVFRNNQNIL